MLKTQSPLGLVEAARSAAVAKALEALPVSFFTPPSSAPTEVFVAACEEGM